MKFLLRQLKTLALGRSAKGGGGLRLARTLSICVALLLIAVLGQASVLATTFPLPTAGNDIVGRLQTAQVEQGDTFSTIARRYDVGYYELVESNPDINPDTLVPGTVLVIPTRHILPKVPYEGIVINLAEMRLYYFLKDSHQVVTVPVGIGRRDWDTPLGVLTIVEKMAKPTWHVPDSIREARALEGVDLPHSVAPGPENPLGNYAMRLSMRTYLIHGTNDPSGVGRRSSSGCIRLYPEDIEYIFNRVSPGTPVRIINQPYKLGWRKNKLYIEAHQPLAEHASPDDLTLALNTIKEIAQLHPIHVDWNKVTELAEERSGIPEIVGVSIDTAEQMSF
jgi:L,D-transpeptidase ErfK/SrfK